MPIHHLPHLSHLAHHAAAHALHHSGLRLLNLGLRGLILRGSLCEAANGKRRHRERQCRDSYRFHGFLLSAPSCCLKGPGKSVTGVT
jgi:hypothetical protein